MKLGFTKNKKGKNELDDTDIGHFFQLLTTKNNLAEKNISLFQNAFIFGNLMMRFDESEFVARSSKGLTRRMKKSEFVFAAGCQKIGDDSGHWTLFVYDKNNKTFHHYNSLNGINNLDYFRPLLKKLSEFLEIGNKVRIIEHQTPQQGDSVSCGLYVIAITEFLVRRYQNNSSVMNWEINDKEAQEIKNNVPWFRKMLEEGEDYFADLATETTSKRNTELDQIRGIIISAQTIFDKGKATKEELEQAINHLKTLSTVANDSREAQVWAENKTANEKLLIGLTEKLNNIGNSTNSNKKTPHVETKPEKEKGKPADHTVKPDSGKDNINSNDNINPNHKPTPPPTLPEDKVKQDLNKNQEKNKNSLKNDINQAKNGTDEDKFNAIKNSGRVLGEQGFDEQKSELAVIEEELALNNPPKHLEAIRAKIEENLKKNKLTMEELDSEIQADYQNIKDNKDKVDKINESIGKLGAQKRIKKLKEKISKISKSSKEKIQKLKEKLLRIIHSKNKYEQEYRKEARNLLAQLEKVSQTHQPKSGFPTGWVVGGGVLAVIGLVAFLVIRSKRRKKSSF